MCAEGSSHHEGDGEVVQSGGSVVVGQVGVQVPWRVWRHSLNAKLPVDEHITNHSVIITSIFSLVELDVKTQKLLIFI